MAATPARKTILSNGINDVGDHIFEIEKNKSTLNTKKNAEKYADGKYIAYRADNGTRGTSEWWLKNCPVVFGSPTPIPIDGTKNVIADFGSVDAANDARERLKIFKNYKDIDASPTIMKSFSADTEARKYFQINVSENLAQKIFKEVWCPINNVSYLNNTDFISDMFSSGDLNSVGISYTELLKRFDAAASELVPPSNKVKDENGNTVTKASVNEEDDINNEIYNSAIQNAAANAAAEEQKLKEQQQTFFEKYRTIIIIVAIAVVLLVVGILVFKFAGSKTASPKFASKKQLFV